jgi:hypothetical protein
MPEQTTQRGNGQASQPFITKYQRNLWTKALKRLLNNKHSKLKQTVGKWTRITHRGKQWQPLYISY